MTPPLAAKPTGTILDRILETKRGEVAALLARESRQNLAARCEDTPATRGFNNALASPPNPLPEAGRESLQNDSQAKSERFAEEYPIPAPPSRFGEGIGGRGQIALIAEVKKASPSKGVIRADFDPAAIARAYYEGGASCLSVLTDETYFQGRLDYLRVVREAVPLPLLRKDFIIDTAQIYEARLAGADAVLLIVAAFPDANVLREMRETAESVGLDVLVEVHDEEELQIAAQSGASLIGVNNRNLHTFEVSLEATERLIPLFPPGAVAVAESGIFTPRDVERVRQAGAHAVLVGESLMRANDIAHATRVLMGHS